MKATRFAIGGLAVCLSFTLSLSDEFESRQSLSAHLQQSVDYYDAGEFEQSLQSAENALAVLVGQSAVAYNNICSAQMKLGAYEQAALACNKALQLSPGYERAQSNLAWVYERVVEQTPTVGAYLNLSVVRYRQNDLGQSFAAARKALELDPHNAVAHNNLCAAFAKGGEWQSAIAECEIALEIEPEFERARNNLAWARTGAAD